MTETLEQQAERLSNALECEVIIRLNPRSPSNQIWNAECSFPLRHQRAIHFAANARAALDGLEAMIITDLDDQMDDAELQILDASARRSRLSGVNVPVPSSSLTPNLASTDVVAISYAPAEDSFILTAPQTNVAP